MNYTLIFSKRALKSLKRIESQYRKNILDALETLAYETDPKKHVKKIRGNHQPPFYSMREGDYRVIMSIIDDRMIIHVVEAGHRSKIYRKY